MLPNIGRSDNPQENYYYESNYNQNQYPNFYERESSMNMGTIDNHFGYNVNLNDTVDGIKLKKGILAAFGTLGYPGEPSLSEELGINFHHIKTKTLAVLNPFSQESNLEVTEDLDLAGPIFFVLSFGISLLLAGKIQFGYIYGVGFFGTLGLHYLFKFMSNDILLSLANTTSVIGYCFLPLVFISIIGVFMSLDNYIGYFLCGVSVVWCTYLSSGFITSMLKLHNVRPLIAYPLSLFYTFFVLMAIFVEKKKK